jgi:8-oxo-dGTP diphosphatase
MNAKLHHVVNPRVSTDCVIFGFDNSKLNLLLITRKSKQSGESQRMALPGDLIYEDENLDQAASRVLGELTGLKDIYLQQIGAFGDPERLSASEDRDWLESVREQPDARVITVAYFSLVNMRDYAPQASSFAASARWVPLEMVRELAFDHQDILNAAKRRLRETLKNKPVGFNLLPEKFTLTQLHHLYEAILDKPLDKRNFRRKMLKLNILTRLEEKQKGVPHKPSRYYTFNQENYERLSDTGYNNFDF